MPYRQLSCLHEHGGAAQVVLEVVAESGVHNSGPAAACDTFNAQLCLVTCVRIKCFY